MPTVAPAIESTMTAPATANPSHMRVVALNRGSDSVSIVTRLVARAAEAVV